MLRKGLVFIGLPLLVVIFLPGCGGGSGGSSSSGGSGGSTALSVAVTTSATTVDGAGVVTLTAAVTNDSHALGVSWTLSGAGTLSNTTSTSATYTAPAATTSSQTATITATSKQEETRYATTTITVALAPTITTTSSALAGKVGTPYSVQLAGSGGVSPYTWSVVSGSTLPAGLSLSTAGVISGTPLATAAGTTNVAIQMTDSGTPTPVSITKTLGISITAATAITFSGVMPATAFNNQTYAGSAAASGGVGTLTYTLNSGALPAGLTLNATTGAVTGTITTTGTYSFTIRAADAYGDSATQGYQVVVSSPLITLTPTAGSLPFAVTGQAYSQTLTASGGTGTGYTWVVSGLSNGFTYSANGSTLTISGPATTAGTVSFTVTATDSANNSSGSLQYSILIYSPVTLPLTIPATLPSAAAVNTPYTGTVAASGGSGNYSWTVTGQSDGLTTASSGGTLTVSGTPTTAATVSLNVSIKDTATGLTAGPYTYVITVYGALALPAPNPTSLPAGYTSVPYTGKILASGGSGSYSWQVTGLSDNLTAATSGSTLTISGTPGSTPATVTFNVTLTDTATKATFTQSGYSIAIITPAPLTLPTPNPTSLPSATTNELYAGSISASGGVSPYTWSVNGVSIPNTGAAVSIDDGISVSSDGSNVLSVGGTPTLVQTVNLTNVKVTDYLGSTQTNSYTIAVAGLSQIIGAVSLNPNCGAGTPSVPAITLTLLTSPGGTIVKTVTTDASGNFTFTGVHNGSYTITPSIIGPSSVFYPATLSATVNNADVSGENFKAALGYTVSGSVSYGGSNTGQIYLSLLTSSTCGSGALGTSVFTPGSFTIRGVPPGTYTLQAWMDLTALANGAQNTSDPSGSTPVSVAAANVTGASVSLTDNTPASVPSANPVINAIAPTDQGVTISYKAVKTSSVEAATSYDVQWSTSSTFATSPVSFNVKAIGTGSNVWILNNSTSGLSGSPFTNGQTYYFEARARNAAGPASSWTVYGGTTPIGVTIGASTTGNQVQGTVTIPSGITPTGPLYVGYYNQSTNAVYGTRIASPGNSNAFTVYVPTDTSSNYVLFGILDQNNDGLIDAGDVTNTRNKNSSGIAITGPLTGQDLTLPTANSTATVGVQYYRITGQASSSTSSGYNLNFDVREGNKLPVAVTLLSGPNVINPVDIGNYCQGCGSVQFQYHVPINPDMPAVGDAYSFQVTYSDSSSDTETLTPSVSGWNGSTSLVGPSNLATSLSPYDQIGLKPSFAWGVPSVDSSDTFSFYLADSSGNAVWQIPGNNSNSIGFSSAITSLTWGIDPTDPANDLASGVMLTDQEIYSWQMQAQDSNGNQALAVQYFQASGLL